MTNIDIIRLALKNFLRRKVRTTLTILGVVIGTAAIVVMLSLGIGMNESFKKEISRMGSLNTINVDPYYMPDGPQTQYRPQKQVKIDDKIVEQIGQIQGVEAVTPVVQSSMKFSSGKYVAYMNIMAINPEVMDKFDFVASEGRILNKDDTNAVIFGFTVLQQFYNPKSRGGFYYGGNGQKPPVDVLTAKIMATFDMSYGEKRMPGSPQGDNKPPKLFKIDGVGILPQSNNEKDYSAYMNLAYFKKIIREAQKGQGQGSRGGMNGMIPDLSNGYQQVLVKVKNINDVEKVQKQIKDMGLGARSLGDILKSMQKTAQTMQAVLGGIGAISLLVAALGITNTMIMSIYERTREIGIMKVLGCVLTDIKKLFLLESGLIGFVGGIVGILFSLSASFLLNKFGASIMGSLGGGGMPMGPGESPNKVSVIPVWLMLGSVGFATFVGLASGYYPARRAMRLSALEAIRAE